jgi:hypothetical protein
MGNKQTEEVYNDAELIELAVDCIEKDTESAKISGSENIQIFKWVIPVIFERFEIDNEEYEISENRLNSEIRTFLNDIKTKENPGIYFKSNLDEFKEQVRSIPSSNYTIAFPLNLEFAQGRTQDEFTALGHRIQKVSRNRWLKDYRDVCERDEKADHDQPGDDPFTSFMDEIPNDFNRDYTYWIFEIQAKDQQFAVNRLEKTLEYLLGKINLSAYANQGEGISTSSSPWPSGWSDLKLPFIYLVFEDGDYSMFFYDTDISVRKPFSVHSASRSKYDHYFDLIPTLTHPLEDVEATFVETLRRFQSAISTASREDSFLQYWRGIESLTLTDETDDMAVVIKRASAPIKHKRPRLFNFRLEQAREKRNDLVHEGIDVSVNKHDQNLLKNVLEDLIWVYSANIEKWGKSEFKFFLDNVKLDSGHLEKKQETLSKNIDILERILEEKEYEPSGLEKILLDWAREQNYLEDADFLDPIGFFFPVFGAGSDDSEIMIVAKSPVYLYSNEEISTRSRIRGPVPDTTHWTLDKITERSTDLLKQSNPNGVWDILTSIADAVDIDTEEIYLTTLQKDGVFDETLNEIGDGFDPIDLNRRSLKSWEPYLNEEINEVEPSLIVVLGEDTKKSIVNLLSLIEDESYDEVPDGEIYTIDKYQLLCFQDLSEEDPTIEKSLPSHIADKVREKDW